MKALRILQVTNRIPWPLNDGGNIATYHVGRELLRLGHSVSLASLNTVKHFQDPAVLSALYPVHAVEIDTSIQLAGLIKGIFSPHPYNVWRFWSDAFAQLLGELLERNDFDIVQFEGSYLALYSKVVRKHSKAKLVLRSHNVEHVIWQRLALAEPGFFKRMYLRNLSPKIARFEREHLNDFDAIVPIANQDRDWYEQAGFKGRLRTITGGVDLETFQPAGAGMGPKRICFLGSLEWLPNIQGLEWFLSEVWPSLRVEFPDLEFWVAGKNPAEGFLQDAPEGVRMLGMVDDAAKFMLEGRIMIVPLFSGGGMRIKVLEAMAAGRVVFSTGVGVEGIACTHGKDVWLAEGVVEWVAGLKGLLRDEDACMQLQAKARALAEARYGWGAIGREFEQFHGEVCG